MSQQRSLELRRAELAWTRVQAAEARGPAYAKAYGTLARSAPADLQANGSGQTLAFWRAKDFDKGQPKQGSEHAGVLEDVSLWLRGQLGLDEGTDIVQWISQTASTDQYRRATTEAMAFLAWVKRFAEAELPREGEA